MCEDEETRGEDGTDEAARCGNCGEGIGGLYQCFWWGGGSG